jgi:hypothetical protein
MSNSVLRGGYLVVIERVFIERFVIVVLMLFVLALRYLRKKKSEYLALANLWANFFCRGNKIFVMTGLNDTAWVSQTKERLPIANVIHRGQLKNFKAKLKGDLDNILIMIEEHNLHGWTYI